MATRESLPRMQKTAPREPVVQAPQERKTEPAFVPTTTTTADQTERELHVDMTTLSAELSTEANARLQETTQPKDAGELWEATNTAIMKLMDLCSSTRNEELYETAVQLSKRIDFYLADDTASEQHGKATLFAVALHAGDADITTLRRHCISEMNELLCDLLRIAKELPAKLLPMELTSSAELLRFLNRGDMGSQHTATVFSLLPELSASERIVPRRIAVPNPFSTNYVEHWSDLLRIERKYYQPNAEVYDLIAKNAAVASSECQDAAERIPGIHDALKKLELSGIEGLSTEEQEALLLWQSYTQLQSWLEEQEERFDAVHDRKSYQRTISNTNLRRLPYEEVVTILNAAEHVKQQNPLFVANLLGVDSDRLGNQRPSRLFGNPFAIGYTRAVDDLQQEVPSGGWAYVKDRFDALAQFDTTRSPMPILSRETMDEYQAYLKRAREEAEGKNGIGQKMFGTAIIVTAPLILAAEVRRALVDASLENRSVVLEELRTSTPDACIELIRNLEEELIDDPIVQQIIIERLHLQHPDNEHRAEARVVFNDLAFVYSKILRPEERKKPSPQGDYSSSDIRAFILNIQHEKSRWYQKITPKGNEPRRTDANAAGRYFQEQVEAPLHLLLWASTPKETILANGADFFADYAAAFPRGNNPSKEMRAQIMRTALNLLPRAEDVTAADWKSLPKEMDLSPTFIAMRTAPGNVERVNQDGDVVTKNSFNDFVQVAADPIVSPGALLTLWDDVRIAQYPFGKDGMSVDELYAESHFLFALRTHSVEDLENSEKTDALYHGFCNIPAEQRKAIRERYAEMNTDDQRLMDHFFERIKSAEDIEKIKWSDAGVRSSIESITHAVQQFVVFAEVENGIEKIEEPLQEYALKLMHGITAEGQKWSETMEKLKKLHEDRYRKYAGFGTEAESNLLQLLQKDIGHINELQSALVMLIELAPTELRGDVKFVKRILRIMKVQAYEGLSSTFHSERHTNSSLFTNLSGQEFSFYLWGSHYMSTVTAREVRPATFVAQAILPAFFPEKSDPFAELDLKKEPGTEPDLVRICQLHYLCAIAETKDAQKIPNTKALLDEAIMKTFLFYKKILRTHGNSPIVKPYAKAELQSLATTFDREDIQSYIDRAYVAQRDGWKHYKVYHPASTDRELDEYKEKKQKKRDT